MRQFPPSLAIAHETPRLLVRVRDKIRLKHYSICTERVYADWVWRLILFHENHHPAELGAHEVEKFLIDPATFIRESGRILYAIHSVC